MDIFNLKFRRYRQYFFLF